MRLITSPKLFFITILGLITLSNLGSAEDLSYDRYTSVLRNPKNESTLVQASQEFLTYPFELLRWPISKSLVFIEKNKLDKKARWAYETSVEHGVTPHLGVITLSGLSVGAELDAIRLADKKAVMPNAVANAWIHYAQGVYFRTGSELGWKHIGDTGLKGSFYFNYEHRPEEHFYGLGTHSSAGDGSVYEMEDTVLALKSGYEFSPIYSFDFSFGFKNTNISGGKDGGRGQIEGHPTFVSSVVPGLHGDEMLFWNTALTRDTRDHKQNSKSGGLQQFSFSYNEGLDDSHAKFFKYQLELSKYLTLGSERRVLALRFFGEHNDEVSDGHVPFHQMAKLGGFGDYPRLSETLRGYDFNRFFDDSMVVANIEYRYNIWHYRAFKGDAVLFLDEGQVFREFSEFKLNDLRESYGLGLRLSVADITVLSLEWAHGDEGSNFYVKSSSPF